MSSQFLAPILELLAPHCTVFAPDTPGYGLSTPLPPALAATDLSPYVQVLAEFLDSLKISRTALYGTATGAQIAIEFARAHPRRVEFVVVENAASFTPAQRDAIMEHYFPDLTPRGDGSHLAAAWTMARDLYTFFPWCAQDSAHRLPTALPPVEMVHAVSRATLGAGAEYARAYRAAFLNEDARRIQSLSVPVVVIRWAGSILRSYMDAFDALQWPDHIHVVDCGPSMEERMDTLERIVVERAVAGGGRVGINKGAGGSAEAYAGGSIDAGESIDAGRSIDAGGSANAAGDGELPAHDYLAADTALLHVLQRAGKGRPLLLLPDFASSAAAVLAELAAFPLGKQPVGILDLPGHGASDAPSSAGLEPFLDMIAAALENWHPAAPIDVLGLGGAGLVALQLGRRLAPRVQRVLLAGERPPKSELCAQAAPSLQPRWDGGHWQSAWHAARDARLFRPWYCRDAQHRRHPLADLSAAALHRASLDLMDCAPSLSALLEGFGQQSWEEAQAHCPCPVELLPLAPAA